jgi:DNA repair photolyase
MKISATEKYTSDGLSVSIHISPVSPRHQEEYYFDVSQVVKVSTNDDVPYNKGTIEYTASVFKKYLPEIFYQLKKHKYDMILSFNMDYY